MMASSTIATDISDDKNLPLPDNQENPDVKKHPIPKELPEGFKFHVFLSHSHHDSEEKDEIIKFLEEENGYVCCNPDKEFPPGKDVVSCITDSLQISKKVVVIISKEFLDSTYQNLEVGIALEREGRSKNVTLIPVVKGIKPKDVPAKLRRQNLLTWKEKHFEERLLKAIELQELSTLVPAGDIAHGLAWSYFYGYLNLVLPGMQQRVMDSELKKKETLKDIPFLDKMMIILPQTGYCPTSLKTDDENIVFEGHIPFTVSRAGNIDRNYKSSVYRITDPFDSSREVLVIAEFATPLLSMYEMEAGQIAGLTKPELLAQKLLFEEKLKEILDFEDNKTCHHAYVFCSFDDKRDEDLKPVGWRLSKILADRAFKELDLIQKIKDEKNKREKKNAED